MTPPRHPSPVSITGLAMAGALGESADAHRTTIDSGNHGLRPLGEFGSGEQPFPDLLGGWIGDRGWLSGRRYGGASNAAVRIAKLAADGAYDGVVFHRVIDGFMAQTGDVEFGKMGGDMNMAGRGGSDMPDLPAEFSDIPFEQGMVGMARSQSPNSANSQFFIMLDEGMFLNGQYTIVGKVTDGLDVVDQIKLGKGPNGAVIGKPDVMKKVTVID